MSSLLEKIYAETYAELGEGVGTAEPGTERELLGEISRRSPEYIRWVQGSLNRIMGLRLAVDGVLGPRTRSAIRSFQQRQKLAPDGIVGPKTEAALVSAGKIAPPKSMVAQVEARPVFRLCCLLTPTTSPFSPDSNLVDPSALGIHGTKTEATGILYSGKGGFLDLGHIREACDNTKAIYDKITARKGAPGVIKTLYGRARVHTRIPTAEQLRVASSISYDDLLAHEIHSYDVLTPGMHNSAFSPEDLVSNYLGTVLAERAVTAGGNFNVAVTNELRKLLFSLDAQTKSESLKAFNLIKHCWVDFNNVSSFLQPGYLKRRNFIRDPWKSGHASDKPTPAWVVSNLYIGGTFARMGLGPPEAYYTYMHDVTKRIDKTAFVLELNRIRKDAKTKYGPNFDQAFPC